MKFQSIMNKKEFPKAFREEKQNLRSIRIVFDFSTITTRTRRLGGQKINLPHTLFQKVTTRFASPK